MIIGFSVSKLINKNNYPADLNIKQHKDLFDIHIIGTPLREQDTDGTIATLERAALECGQNLKIMEFDWPTQSVWTEESLDKTIQRKILDYIINKYKSKNNWIIKADNDEFYNEKDFDQIKTLCSGFSEDNSVTAIVTNYLQFCKSLQWTIDDPTYRVSHVFRSDGETIFFGNDAMILKTSWGEEVYLEDIFLYHVGYCKSPKLLTRKIKEHVVLNASVYGNRIDKNKLDKFEFEFPEHKVGKKLWPLGLATLCGQENSCEYYNFNPDDLPRELKNNRERFNYV